jgi:hypothetical protein
VREDRLAVQGAQQDVGDHLRVGAGPLGGDERADVAVPEAVDGVVGVLGARVGGLGRVRRVRPGLGHRAEGELGQQALVPADDLDDGVEEGKEPVPVGRAGPQRRRPGGHRLGQRLRALDHQGRHQPHPVAEPVEDGALADPGHRRDLLDRDVLGPVGSQELLGGGQDRAAVARRVSALGSVGAHPDIVPLGHAPLDNWTIGPLWFAGAS